MCVYGWSDVSQSFSLAGASTGNRQPINSRACKYSLNLLMHISSTPKLAQVRYVTDFKQPACCLLCTSLDTGCRLTSVQSCSALD